MKIGDKFIAEEFKSVHGCSFLYYMNQYIGRVCEITDLRKGKVLVMFEDGQEWEWLTSALKPIKGFYVGQKVYSHLFPTDDCSGIVEAVKDWGNLNDIHTASNGNKFYFSKDGRYVNNGGICLFTEPIERSKPKFEYGELVLVSDNERCWHPRYFKEGDTVFSAYNNKKELCSEQTWKHIKKYE